MKQIAIFASGSGTNAQRIIEHFQNHPTIHVALVLSNKADAFVLERANKLGVQTIIFSRQQFYETDDILRVLADHAIDFIVLAGFLWLIPTHLLLAYPNKIVNIHPALLPKYGGKGMYGMKVHEAVIAAGDKESGITIHFVNDKYDEGQIVHQAKCTVEEGETTESLAQKIHGLEHSIFPEVVERMLGAGC